MELKTHSLAELEAIYTDGDEVDKVVFADMRSSILLVAGEHYTKRRSEFYQRIRDAKDLSDRQKIRLTKNHIQKICKLYTNNILSMNPGVAFNPKNENELQDQKAAELHAAIWEDAKERYNLAEKKDDWCEDFVTTGECAVKIYWDSAGGKLKGYEPQAGEDGTPAIDETGQAIPDYSKPVHEGQMVFEQIHGFNLLRSGEAKDMRESHVLMIRKMLGVKELKAKYKDLANKIDSSMDQTVMVFDNARGGYRKAQNEVMIREFYFRPCAQYPNGYFYITTREVILEQGELPGGIWPIVWAGFDKVQTTPRGRSPVKVMRPYQIEINRCASKIAEHQMTLGDDKLVMNTGTKATQGPELPGVRVIEVTGPAPTVIPGRDGSQFVQHMQNQIDELYKVMMVDEDSVEVNGQLDPYALLFRAASQKKKFKRYIERFERFLIEVARVYIELARFHMPEDAVVMAVGRPEQINIAEFKNAQPIGYQINIDAQAEDIESKMGSQLVLNHVLQYTGQKLDKEDIGKLVRLMPYANIEEGFSDLTLDYDSATNMILSLDRGQPMPPNPYDKHMYMIQRLTSRMRKADFQFLDPRIQEMYRATVETYQQLEVTRQEQIQAAKDGFIPTGGYLVSCDFYAADPKDPAKTKRVRLPADAVSWLIKRLETQGASLDQIEKTNEGALQQMAQMMISKGQPGGAPGREVQPMASVYPPSAEPGNPEGKVGT